MCVCVCVCTGAGVGGDGGMRMGHSLRDSVLGGMGALSGEDDEDGLVFGVTYAHPLGGIYTYTHIYTYTYTHTYTLHTYMHIQEKGCTSHRMCPLIVHALGR